MDNLTSPNYATQVSREVRFLAQNAPETIWRPGSTRTQWGAYNVAGFKGGALGREKNGEGRREGDKREGRGRNGAEGWERKDGAEWE